MANTWEVINDRFVGLNGSKEAVVLLPVRGEEFLAIFHQRSNRAATIELAKEWVEAQAREKIRAPKWAKPHNSMTEEELRFAIEAEGIIDFMNRRFTRSEHVACYAPEHRDQAGKDWDEVEKRLAN